MSETPDRTALESETARLLDTALAGARPRPGWENRVLANIDRRRGQRLWRTVTVSTLAFGAAAFALFRGLTHRGAPPAETSMRAEPQLLAQLELEPAPGAPVTRSDHKAGDLIVARVSGIGHRHVEVRIYVERKLIVRCDRTAPCLRTGDTLSARIATRIRGQYDAVVASSDRPLPAPAGAYDEDMAALERDGVVHVVKSYQLM